eukprot:4648543-Pleurochrysis_carterae.AAC.7
MHARPSRIEYAGARTAPNASQEAAVARSDPSPSRFASPSRRQAAQRRDGHHATQDPSSRSLAHCCPQRRSRAAQQRCVAVQLLASGPPRHVRATRYIVARWAASSLTIFDVLTRAFDSSNSTLCEPCPHQAYCEQHFLG